MTGDLVLSNREVQGKSTALTDGGSDTGYGNGALALTDNNDAKIGYIRPLFNAAGQWVSIYPRRSSGSVNELRLGLDANGNALVAFNGTGAQAAWLAALGLPAITDAAAWLSALGLTVEHVAHRTRRDERIQHRRAANPQIRCQRRIPHSHQAPSSDTRRHVEP